MKAFSILLELIKYRISLLATLSASAGFILAKQELSREIILPLTGILFLACGCCALNQYQERKTDGLMERTKGRPLPAGKLNPLAALGISSGLIISGSLILYSETHWASWGLGLFAVLWYNGAYTYLKQKTAFAVIPGALVGVIPPVLGWVSGGGSLLDPRIRSVAFFFFIWQVPHFWLLLLDFGRDYDRAGLPSLAKILTIEQLKRVIFIWMLSTALSSLFIPLFGFVNFYPVHFLLLMATFWLVRNAINFFKSPPKEVSFRFAFTRLNIYVLLVIAVLFLDKLLTSDYIKLKSVIKMLAMIRFTPV